LNEGLTLQGLGNWAAVAEHIGTRTKEEVEKHYNRVYIDSLDFPLPVRANDRICGPELTSSLQRMDLSFDIPQAEFQARKKRRIENLSSSLAASSTIAPKAAPVSAPGVHEVATYLPGRLEFEHELDNEAEDAVKDMEFGIVLDYGGDEIPEDENDVDVKARKRFLESRGTKRKRSESMATSGKTMVNGLNGYHVANGHVKAHVQAKAEEAAAAAAVNPGEGDNGEDPTAPLLPIETPESIRFKLSMLEMYHQHVLRRHEAKAFIFERGLLEYKKVCQVCF